MLSQKPGAGNFTFAVLHKPCIDLLPNMAALLGSFDKFLLCRQDTLGHLLLTWIGISIRLQIYSFVMSLYIHLCQTYLFTCILNKNTVWIMN